MTRLSNEFMSDCEAHREEGIMVVYGDRYAKMLISRQAIADIGAKVIKHHAEVCFEHLIHRQQHDAHREFLCRKFMMNYQYGGYRASEELMEGLSGLQDT